MSKIGKGYKSLIFSKDCGIFLSHYYRTWSADGTVSFKVTVKMTFCPMNPWGKGEDVIDYAISVVLKQFQSSIRVQNISRLLLPAGNLKIANEI